MNGARSLCQPQRLRGMLPAVRLEASSRLDASHVHKPPSSIVALACVAGQLGCLGRLRPCPRPSALALIDGGAHPEQNGNTLRAPR
jgi:hypothetical protein